MKTALVHDWLTTMAGAEKVLESMYNLYPSDIYTLVSDQSQLTPPFDQADITTSMIQKFPFAKTKYRNYLPLFPFAIEQFDLSEYDVILSSSHAVAKGVLTHAGQLHITYMHTPIRYAWDLYFRYLKEAGLQSGLKGLIAKKILHNIRLWDSTTANRPDAYIANSRYIARRIAKVYGKKAEVIYPPVEVDSFTLEEKKDNYYMTASRMVPYKKIDVIVEAFSKMPEKKLIVIGDGPDFNKIKQKASKNIELLGYQPFEVLKTTMQKAKAFVFAAEEDFGIIPVEAQACGTPVIAYGKGGACETVKEGETGLFFDDQRVESLIKAVEAFEKEEFDPQAIRRHAMQFSKERFEKEYYGFIESEKEKFFEGLGCRSI